MTTKAKTRASSAGLKKGSEGTTAANSPAGHRERILKAAMTLLAKGGRDALTTRAVAEAARVQPPVLYRLFNDKAGLLRAVADHGFSAYLATKRTPAPAEDPVESLRAGWNLHIHFGLTHPELYLLMYADPHPEFNPEPHPANKSHVAERSHRLLLDHMQGVAAAGRLRVSEERAALLFHAAACGTVMTLLSIPEAQRDMSLSDSACDATLASLVTGQPISPPPSLTAAATTLRALITSREVAHPSATNVLSAAEHILLIEWLDRLASA